MSDTGGAAFPSVCGRLFQPSDRAARPFANWALREFDR